VRANREGLTNDVLIVNEQFVFRFPKNDTCAPSSSLTKVDAVSLI
jgi:hypothetical protein